jgi:DEAD/DEAH box helicase domain-containing protein
VKCAAFELPFTATSTFGAYNVQEMLSILSEEGFVQKAGEQWQWTHESYPADAVSLRSISSDNFIIVDLTHGERVIGETDFTSAPSVLHEKAIYIVEGQLYQVERLDFDGRKAFVRAVECDYYTDAIDYTKVTILDEMTSEVGSMAGDEPTSEVIASPAHHGEVHVVSRVVGFKKIKFYTNENIGSGELDLPEQQMHTSSYWLTIPRETMEALPHGLADRRDGVLGLAFAMRNVAPLLLMCDSHDLGLSVDGVTTDEAARTAGTVAPTIFIYDNYPGGIGFSEPLHGMHDDLIAKTQELIDGCPCQSGCPSCVGPEGNTGPLAKTVASHLLRLLTPPPLAVASEPAGA